MKIAIDLDNTLISFNKSWFDKLSDEYNYKLDDHTTWRLENYSESFRVKSVELFRNEIFLNSLLPYDGSYSKLQEWYDKKYEINVISARDLDLESITVSFVNRVFPMVSNTIIAGPLNTKEEFLRNGNYDVLIDDNPLCVKAASTVGIKYIYMVSNSDTRYNVSYIDDYKKCGVNIVSSVFEIEL